VWGRIPDVIIHAKFYVNRFTRVFEFWHPKSAYFSGRCYNRQCDDVRRARKWRWCASTSAIWHLLWTNIALICLIITESWKSPCARQSIMQSAFTAREDGNKDASPLESAPAATNDHIRSRPSTRHSLLKAGNISTTLSHVWCQQYWRLRYDRGRQKLLTPHASHGLWLCEHLIQPTTLHVPSF